MDDGEYRALTGFLQSQKMRARIWPASLSTENARRNFRKKANKFVLLDGTLHYLRRKTGKPLRVIKVSEKESILTACHVIPVSGHQGVNKTTTKIMSHYYWPGAQCKDITDFIATCDECQRNNHLRKVPAVLHPIPPPDGSFKQFGMDLVGPLSRSASGNRYIVVLTDHLTKWPEAEAIPNKEATTVAKFLVKIICRYSTTRMIITDQGREFCNSVNEICQRLGIDHRKTTAYHPQANGQTEWYNQSLCNAIAKYINSEQDNWDDFIDPILLAYRSSVHKSTKKTPFFLAFGMEPTLLVEETFPVGKPQEPTEIDKVLDHRIAASLKLFNIHQDAKANIEQAQAKRKHYFDLKHQPPAYQIGDLVLV